MKDSSKKSAETGLKEKSLAKAQRREEIIRLNLGCGLRKADGYINIDNREETGPDLCIDVAAGLPYEDGTVDEVRAFDFLEHVPRDKVIFVMEEIWRVLKPGGRLEHFTPSTDGRGAFQDPTHRSYWNINSWLYYMNDQNRALYGIKAKFEGMNQDLITDKANNVRHTHGMLRAVKGDEIAETK